MTPISCAAVRLTNGCAPQAALYEKLSATAGDDEEERYNVDFLRKGVLSDEAPGTSHGAGRGSAPIDTVLDALGQGGAHRLFL